MNSLRIALRKLRALTMRTLPLMITCRELEGFMIDYLEGDLPKRQRRRFDLHLRLCPDCWRYVEAYKQTITLSQAACQDRDTPLPEDMPEELVEAILAARDKDA